MLGNRSSWCVQSRDRQDGLSKGMERRGSRVSESGVGPLRNQHQNECRGIRMDWLGWWLLANLVVSALGALFMGKAYYDYFRNSGDGVSPPLVLSGFVLFGVGVLSQLAYLLYTRIW